MKMLCERHKAAKCDTVSGDWVIVTKTGDGLFFLQKSLLEERTQNLSLVQSDAALT